VEWWLPGAGEGKSGELIVHRYRVSTEEDGKVLEMDSRDGCTTM
jgi:hypothetical protein